jgi:hypothetical protein
MDGARANTRQLPTRDLAARIAHEDRVQTKAALPPTLNRQNTFSYSQRNGSEDRDLTFSTSDGPTGEGGARERTDIAARGLISSAFQNCHGVAAAQRHFRNAELSPRETLSFAGITHKQEGGREPARADVVKAQLTAEQRVREVQDARLAAGQARYRAALANIQRLTGAC